MSMHVDPARRTSGAHVFIEVDALDDDGPVGLDDETAHHLSRVLRLRVGEDVTVSDGAGRWRRTEVADAKNFRLETTGDVETDDRPYAPLTLAAAIPKGDRLDWMVQKVVELGVDTLQLLDTDRSDVRWKPERADKQIVRLRRIAVEAARQSRRVWLPEIAPPVAANTILPGATIAEPGGRNVSKYDTCLAIGPAGGWSERECESAADRVTLGSNVLRTETAALAAVTLYVANCH